MTGLAPASETAPAAAAAAPDQSAPGRTAPQRAWAATPVRARLRILRAARHRMASSAERFTAAISPSLPRSSADTLTAELLPLLDACRFLERNAARLLRPRKLGRRGRPVWLGGVHAEIHREPFGEVLVIGPANFPLFLPGAQALQALAAGNSVVWKPAPGGHAVALLVADALHAAGLPQGLLRITGESIEAAQTALAGRPAKVFFTGSHATGTALLAQLAATATPSVMELSGADAVVVFPGADLPLVARAVAFGLRLNGAQVCMSPRRLFAEPATLTRLLPLLTHELSSVPPVELPARTSASLRDLLAEARAGGAELLGDFAPGAQLPLLVHHARPAMRIAQADLFAPVLSLLELPSLADLPLACAACPFALTVSLFCSRGEEPRARALGLQLPAGTVLLNDLIAPTADPRIPFGGRGASGFGVTRGAEGLLEMTAPKVLLTRRGGAMRHLAPTTAADAPLLASLLRVAHAGTWRERWSALQQVAKLGKARGANPHI